MNISPQPVFLVGDRVVTDSPAEVRGDLQKSAWRVCVFANFNANRRRERALLALYPSRCKKLGHVQQQGWGGKCLVSGPG